MSRKCREVSRRCRRGCQHGHNDRAPGEKSVFAVVVTFCSQPVAAATFDRLKVVVAAAEARETLGPTMAESKKPPQHVTFRRILHRMVCSTRCWFGQPDPRVGSKVPPRRSLAPPCGSQTSSGPTSPRNCRRGTMKGTHFFAGPRPQSPSTSMVAIPAARLVSGLSGPNPGRWGSWYSILVAGSDVSFVDPIAACVRTAETTRLRTVRARALATLLPFCCF